jgi:hypothetical protein
MEGIFMGVMDACKLTLNPCKASLKRTTCDFFNLMTLLKGYDGPKPDWYYADNSDFDPSAPTYNEGVEEYFETLKKMNCDDHNGYESPWKDFWLLYCLNCACLFGFVLHV